MVKMSNRLHALLRQPEGQWTLSDGLSDFKKMTVKQIIKRVKSLPERHRE